MVCVSWVINEGPFVGWPRCSQCCCPEVPWKKASCNLTETLCALSPAARMLITGRQQRHAHISWSVSETVWLCICLHGTTDIHKVIIMSLTVIGWWTFEAAMFDKYCFLGHWWHQVAKLFQVMLALFYLYFIQPTISLLA